MSEINTVETVEKKPRFRMTKNATAEFDRRVQDSFEILSENGTREFTREAVRNYLLGQGFMATTNQLLASLRRLVKAGVLEHSHYGRSYKVMAAPAPVAAEWDHTPTQDFSAPAQE